ncbi:MAG: diguanylate cyclase [Clostridiales bacterium]|nr:diguanylate cyclase [Clostridiales bacterium]
MIALFILACVCMLVTLLFLVNRIILQVTYDYARQFAANSANALSTHIEKELRFLIEAAGSQAVIDWFSDETDKVKADLAAKELHDVVSRLYSNNLYIGLQNSLYEYSVPDDPVQESMQLVDKLSRSDEEDDWFFSCLEAESDYLLSVNIDHIMQKKRLWLNYKVTRDDEPLGVICTGLSFSHIVHELFSHPSHTQIRSLIIDDQGFVLMDSNLLEDDDFLYKNREATLYDSLSDPLLLAAAEGYLAQIDGYSTDSRNPVMLRPSSGMYRYASITPIRLTNWSNVVLYNSSPLLRMSEFVPAMIIILLFLFIFVLVIHIVSYRLIFHPLARLIDSLSRLKENHQERLYGIDRQDEFGSLSQTIDDLFIKANYDALTGVYNRRFMEILFRRYMEFLFRSNGYLSVLMVDVDFFKQYNDLYGHQEGDHCLQAVAKAITGSLTRSTDFVARYGGEEFLAVLPNTDAAGACRIADVILDKVRRLSIPHAGSTAAEYVTVSVGVTTGKVVYPQDWLAYIKIADDAMYSSKQNGRNRSSFIDFPPTLEQAP